MKKIDPFTKEEFEPRRKNQVFANQKNKADYHNEKANILRDKRSIIDKKINSNHRLLLKILMDKNKIEIDEKILEGKGFFFNVFNHHVRYENFYVNAIYEFIFFKQKDSNNIIIIKDDRF